MAKQKIGVVVGVVGAMLLLGSFVLLGSAVAAMGNAGQHPHHVVANVSSYDATGLGANVVVTVAVGSYYFTPHDLTVTVGTTVVWVWEDGYHTATSLAGAAEAFDSGVIGAPGTYSHTFTIVGANPYYCYIHGVQLHSGNLYVVSDTLATATPTPDPNFTPSPTPTSDTLTPLPTDTPAATVTPTDCANPFVDLGGNVFYPAIHYLYCRSVVNGVDANHFGPAGTSTRAQFAKVVVLGFGLAPYTPSGGPSFSDVPPSYYAYSYIESGYHAGILSGFDAQTCTQIGATFPCYGPNRPITRAQLTKLVVGAAGYAPYTPTQPTFVDVPPSNIFYASIETAHHVGIINGYQDNTFRPNSNIRRDEMAQVVYKGVTTP